MSQALTTLAQEVDGVALERRGLEVREVPNKTSPFDSLSSLTQRNAGPDALYPTATPTAPVPTPTLSFEGTTNVDNGNTVGVLIVPPDTEGDIGTDYYVQSNNLVFEIFDKDTAPRFSAPCRTMSSSRGPAASAS